MLLCGCVGGAQWTVAIEASMWWYSCRDWIIYDSLGLARGPGLNSIEFSMLSLANYIGRWILRAPGPLILTSCELESGILRGVWHNGIRYPHPWVPSARSNGCI